MRFKQVILSSATVASIMLTGSLINPSVFSVVSEAQSASNVSVEVNFGTFYDRLAPDGSWVWYQDRYVWLPENVSDHWRPYTEGHWSYTRRHGWLWVSDERFGWATYHYGRWGYARDIGWYWVPGRRWAPAWVAWSHADNDIAWAPLPPRDDNEVNISISFGDIPDYYWQAVPVSAFLSVNLSGQISNDRDHVRTVVQSSPPQTVVVQNNIVINNVIDIGFIEKQTNTKVVVHDEKPVNNPDAVGKTDGTTVAIFNPDVKVEESAKPAAIKKVEDVAKERVAKGVPQLDLTLDQSKAPVKATDGTAPPVVKTVPPVVDPNASKIADPAKSKKIDQPVAANPPPPVVGAVTTETPLPKPTDKAAGKIKPDLGKTIVVTPVTPPKNADTAKTIVPQTVDPKTLKVVVPAKPKKLDQPAAANPPPPVAGATTPEPPVKKPKEKSAGTTQPDAGKALVVPPAAPPAIKKVAPVAPDKMKSNNAQKPNNKDGKAKVPCDPAVEDCPPAQ